MVKAGLCAINLLTGESLADGLALKGMNFWIPEINECV